MEIQSITLRPGITFALIISTFDSLDFFEVTRLEHINADLRTTLERRWNKVRLGHEALGYSNAADKRFANLYRHSARGRGAAFVIQLPVIPGEKMKAEREQETSPLSH